MSQINIKRYKEMIINNQTLQLVIAITGSVC